MKNFDFPYINDSPVDLSGIEGADKIHDSDYCRCEMCQHADAFEKREAEKVCDDIDQVLMSLSPFALAWATAPESQRRYTEYDMAQYWFRQGQIATNSATIEDLNAMESMMKARGLK